MKASDLRVLVVAPTGRDAALISEALRRADMASETFVDVKAAAGVPLEYAHAMLIAEEELDSESVACLARVLAQQPPWSDIPIVILSTGGAGSKERASVPLGLTTVLERPIRVSTLVIAMRAAVRTRLRQFQMRDGLETQRALELAADEAVRQSEARLSQMADAMPQMVWTARPDGSTDYFNSRWYEFTGLDRAADGTPDWASVLHPDDASTTHRGWESAVLSGGDYHSEFRLWDRERKTWRWHFARGVPARDSQGAIVKWYGTTTDIDDMKKAEENLREVQKLESIGVLAGGIAHDFNNLLCGIIGNISLATETLPADNTVQEYLREAVQCGRRAADLTEQLLAYAGKRIAAPTAVDMTTLVRENIALLRGSVPQNVELQLDLAKELPTIEAEIGQIQQVVMNLLINAAEAMGKIPGRIDVRTSLETQGNAHIPGPHVCLEVRDTGCGMDTATIARIFDPFFTTKFAGRGLGLAAVGGIVRAHKGAIDVQSSPGQGSQFQVFFPVAAGRQAAAVAPKVERRIEKGAGTVLVVDDERVLRNLAKAALERHGYVVRLAENGIEALQILERDPGLYSAVLLDLTMPVMTGEQALPLIRSMAPNAAVILSSGFDESEIVEQLRKYGVSAFLQKPYTAYQLAETLHHVLRNRDSESQADGESVLQ
jgi:PAS domain S-box-containing protein